jgi:NAD(P)-dependent dehydrogenase (short-subunit alcohol dehydrogenase family)
LDGIAIAVAMRDILRVVSIDVKQKRMHTIQKREMQDKHVAITGPTAGIGRCAALALAGQGAELSLLCRNPDKANALAAEITAAGGAKPAIIIVDMASLRSVRAAAEALVASGRPLDVLLNNAGIINTSRRESSDGFEEMLAVNHLAPFLLTGMALPALQRSDCARIVNVASHAHAFVKGMGFEDMQARQSFRTFREYGRSKLANILFTRYLAQRLQGQAITVNCLHPGAVATSLGKNNGPLGGALTVLLKPFFRSPRKGAETSVYLSSSAEVSTVSGAYFVDCKEKAPRPWARDDDAAEQLWRYSEECTGISYML